ncbi:hypothetical protein QOZ80_9AG0673770 [Eleusine coracana subsp. coracana]|nr:hypothetical protein QOZ80_9AG0673770 [Eleusine coracana subsp. coracana]
MAARREERTIVGVGKQGPAMETDAEKLAFIEEVTSDVDAVQERVLAEILGRNAESEYLKECGLAGATDRASFRAKVPMVTYEDVEPYIRRIADGDGSPILTGPEYPVSEFFTSSGTSGGEPKLLPTVEDDVDRRQLLQSLLMPVMKQYLPAGGQETGTGRVLYFLFVQPETKTPGGLPARTFVTSLCKSQHLKNNASHTYTTSPVATTLCQYVPSLNNYGGGLPIVSTWYASSECTYGFNLRPMCDPGEVSYTFMPFMGYFEFLPVDGNEEDASQLVDLARLEMGHEYEVVVTTYSGLNRYRVGDVLRVTGFPFCSARMEMEMEAVNGDVLDRCCLEMEEALSSVYRRKRVVDNSIGPLEIRVIRSGTFEELMDYAVSRGTSMSQYKVPRCVTENPRIIELLDSRVVSSHFSPMAPHWAPDLQSSDSNGGVRVSQD